MTFPIQLPAWQVLIIEDDPLVQLGIEQALADLTPLKVIETVDDGYLAIEAAFKHEPELILMDIGLPGIDGIETTRRIKQKLIKTKVVMLTSHSSENEVLAAFSSGADAYCLKGGRIDGLLSAIATVSQGGVYLDANIAHVALESFKQSAVLSLESKLENRIALSDLSEREQEVLELLVEGLSNPEIASRLFISTNTVKAHMRGLMNKLAANDRVQVAVKALRAGLV